MDQKLLGETAASLMEHCESDSQLTDLAIVAVGIVVILETPPDHDGPRTSFTRTMVSDNEMLHHRSLGLFQTAVLTIQQGYNAE